MSDANPTQHDAAILVLRERERELFGEIQSHQRSLELATARREELLDLIATLSRKPRGRRARAADSSCLEELAGEQKSVFGPAIDGAIQQIAAGVVALGEAA